ncbi:MAG TPA: hypothetical protein VGG64_16035 [Pirellulales bacterium]|jgi:hypothetical protein
MLTVVNDYFRELTERFAQAWNRFWFTPSDALTLSVMRILAGLIALYTIATYTPDLELLFGADGLLAADSVRGLRGDYYGFSYLNVLDTPSRLWAGHLAGLAVLALFTLGLFTRVTSILSLVVVLSYFHRSYVVTSEMEPVLTFVLFYLCLAPAGAYLSLDRMLARRKTRSGEASPLPSPSWPTTVATRLIQIHLTIVYLMMLLAQLNENTWWDGTAMWWLAGRRDSALTDLTWMYAHPWLVNLWTHSFVLFEGAFIVLAWNRWAAPLMVSLGVLVWAPMAVVTGLVPLAVMMVVAGLAFILPGSMRTLLGCCGLSRFVE